MTGSFVVDPALAASFVVDCVGGAPAITGSFVVGGAPAVFGPFVVDPVGGAAGSVVVDCVGGAPAVTGSFAADPVHGAPAVTGSFVVDPAGGASVEASISFVPGRRSIARMAVGSTSVVTPPPVTAKSVSSIFSIDRTFSRKSNVSSLVQLPVLGSTGSCAGLGNGCSDGWL